MDYKWDSLGYFPSKAWLGRVIKQYEKYAADKRIRNSVAFTSENGLEKLKAMKELYNSLPENFDIEILPQLKKEGKA